MGDGWNAGWGRSGWDVGPEIEGPSWQFMIKWTISSEQGPKDAMLLWSCSAAGHLGHPTLWGSQGYTEYYIEATRTAPGDTQETRV